MEKNNQQKHNAKGLYEMALNYDLPGFGGDVTDKVRKAQELLKGKDGHIDYTRAYELLQKACGIKPKRERGEKKMYEKISHRRYLNDIIVRYRHEDDDMLSMAAETDDSFFYRNPFSPFGHAERSIEPQKPKENETEKEYALALARIMMAEMLRTAKGTGKDPNEAIRMLRMVEKYGVKKGGQLEQMAREMMEQIIDEEDEATIADTMNCSVEVREGMRRNGERYSIILHHADGSESELNLKGRNKLVYLLALMAEVSHHDVRLMAKMFVSHQELMVDLAKEIRINTGEKSLEEWVLDFVYKESPDNEHLRNEDGHEGEGYFSYDSHNYSQTKLPIKRELKKCTNGRTEEFKTFELKATGGQTSYTYLSLSHVQIQLPESLMSFVEYLPSASEVNRIMERMQYRNRWIHYYDE
ncbi:MAG: hypothetical protein IKH80_00520 [Bacteroidaceae bacterium]|nr:hypothetical protein [Bacteroidaceae bacterium]